MDNSFNITNNTLMKHIITRGEGVNINSYGIKEGENLFESKDKRLYYGGETPLPYCNYFFKKLNYVLEGDVIFDNHINKLISNVFPQNNFYIDITYPLIYQLRGDDKLSITTYVKNGINELYGGISFNRGSIEYNLTNADINDWRYENEYGYTAYYSFGYIPPNKTITLNRLASFGDIKLNNTAHKIYINFCEISLPEYIDFNNNKLTIVCIVQNGMQWIMTVYFNGNKILTHNLATNITTYV